MEGNVNVKIVAKNIETGKVTYETTKHNICSKAMILTLCRIINGEFSNADNFNLNRIGRQQLGDFIPKYFAMGSNIASSGVVGVTTNPTINDTKLLSEFTDYPRMRLSQRNLIENKPTEPYVKLIIRHYVPVNAYVGMSIAEAGLFSSLTGNSCLFRVTFDRFVKDPLTVIDVYWEITLVSLESSTSANLQIDKSSLFQTIQSVFTKISTEVFTLKELDDYLLQGTIDYASDTATQEQVDQDKQNIDSIIKGE